MLTIYKLYNTIKVSSNRDDVFTGKIMEPLTIQIFGITFYPEGLILLLILWLSCISSFYHEREISLKVSNRRIAAAVLHGSFPFALFAILLYLFSLIPFSIRVQRFSDQYYWGSPRFPLYQVFKLYLMICREIRLTYNNVSYKRQRTNPYSIMSFM